MKSMFIFLTIAFLSLALIACGGSPDIQKENESSIEGNSTLSKVVLEIPTIT